MRSKKIGITILIIGILYMLIISWLISWWYVPDYRNLGPEFISGLSWYTSISFSIIRALSAPLGSMLVIVGFALSVKVEKNRTLFFVFGSIILLFWLGMWYVTLINSKIYGIGGGIIICSFLLSVWSWAKKRHTLEERNRLASDIRIISHLFFLIAAWDLCGLLGSPLFGLRPEIMIEFKTQQWAYTMGAKIMICLALGWIFLAISQYIETTTNKNAG
ncbi:MAG: hypothetical protein K8S00_12775 [Bacteroidales bacterium]|nr:hypothetical protein [Bacteroidales bacterium]